jgi:hypothetical protein
MAKKIISVTGIAQAHACDARCGGHTVSDSSQVVMSAAETAALFERARTRDGLNR